MWIFTDNGFYSAMEHRDNESLLMVRCRSKVDADILGLATSSEVVSTPKADYPWRVVVWREDFMHFVSSHVDGIDYDNFKNSVKRRQGKDRANVYGEVWSALYHGIKRT